MLGQGKRDGRAPIAISYRPKTQDYLPVVVAAIRRFQGDWPIVLLTEAKDLPPADWLAAWQIDAITDWSHSPDANKVRRLWEHQDIFAAHFERWIWWHDDMLLLRPVQDPVAEFSRPRVRHLSKPRPNKKLANWHTWLWDTLGFFECQSMMRPQSGVPHTQADRQNVPCARFPPTGIGIACYSSRRTCCRIGTRRRRKLSWSRDSSRVSLTARCRTSTAWAISNSRCSTGARRSITRRRNARSQSTIHCSFEPATS